MLENTWFIACPASELKNKPLAVEILGQHLVVFRSGKQQIAVLEDRCPHRNVPLSLGQLHNGNIQCAYHGWEFAQDGSCTHVPGFIQQLAKHPCQVPHFAGTENHDFIWINLNPDASTDSIPNEFLATRGIKSDRFCMRTTINASLPNAIENLLDGFHTPYVHKKIVRSPKQQQKVQVQIRAQADRVEAKYTGEQTQSGLISRLLENKKRTHSIGRFISPSVAQLEYCDNKGTVLLITALFTPMNLNCQNISIVIETRKGLAPAFLKYFILKSLFSYVLRQDREILEYQQNNIARFGEENFRSSPLDFIRPYIIKLLDQSLPAVNEEKTYTFML